MFLFDIQGFSECRKILRYYQCSAMVGRRSRSTGCESCRTRHLKCGMRPTERLHEELLSHPGTEKRDTKLMRLDQMNPNPFARAARRMGSDAAVTLLRVLLRASFNISLKLRLGRLRKPSWRGLLANQPQRLSRCYPNWTITCSYAI